MPASASSCSANSRSCGCPSTAASRARYAMTWSAVSTP
jgi:hypothetical protein